MCKLLAFCRKTAFFMCSCWGPCAGKQREIYSELMLGFRQPLLRDTQSLGFKKT